MPVILENQLGSLMAEDLSYFGEKRASILEPAYESYLSSENLRQEEPAPSRIQLLPPSEIAVSFKRCTKTGVATDLDIKKLSDPLADNFYGYYPEEKCIVFKGERGLLDEFVEFAEKLAGEKEVTIALKAADQVRIPWGGLEYGLEYEEFVARVEVLECAMWIRTSPSEHEEGGNRFVELTTASQAPRPSTPKQISTSNGTFNGTHANENGFDHEQLLETPGKGHVPLTASSSPLSSPPPIDDTDEGNPLNEFESESDGSLSPPPEIIETPPWLKRS
ncbi:hypothetical protein F53441_10572 [Fusarium austroafricanum]|uniref:Uncharacterized protein n=1 Tax=Fusarium austroafricanum TaxID=2364996 RepID=A0A8H4K8M8_9HYPO|nr:hypothetical protein F53441_10572 [Fusarium austroafricanum]